MVRVCSGNQKKKVERQRPRSLTLPAHTAALRVLSHQVVRPAGWMTSSSLFEQGGVALFQGEPPLQKDWLHSQNVGAIAEAISVERVAKTPTDDDAAPSAANHFLSPGATVDLLKLGHPQRKGLCWARPVMSKARTCEGKASRDPCG